MEERSLRMVSSFLNSAYQEGRKCLNNETLVKLLDIRHEVEDKLIQVQREELKEEGVIIC